jgi:hypothetical protein
LLTFGFLYPTRRTPWILGRAVEYRLWFDDLEKHEKGNASNDRNQRKRKEKKKQKAS